MSEPVSEPVSVFFDEVARDSRKCIYGVKNLFPALEMSAVDTMLVWDGLALQRVEIKNPNTNNVEVKYITQEGVANLGNGVEIVNRQSLKDWLVAHYSDYGAKLEIVPNKSQDSDRFVNQFGGIGCILRWNIEFPAVA